jgi:hypothetical protein
MTALRVKMLDGSDTELTDGVIDDFRSKLRGPLMGAHRGAGKSIATSPPARSRPTSR